METQFALVYLEILEKSLCKTEQELVTVHNLNSLKIPFSQSSTCLHHFLHVMLWGQHVSSTCPLSASTLLAPAGPCMEEDDECPPIIALRWWHCCLT